MLPVDEVISFSVAYLNRKEERTAKRKSKIRQVYRELFNREMIGSCATCYIEAMLEIVKSFKKINTEKMATANYELKRGVLLESFGHPEKACTNDTLTDELAEWHLKMNPEKAVYFARIAAKPVTNVTIPGPLLQPLPPQPRNQNREKWIVAPDKIIIPEEKPVTDIASSLIAGATEAPKEKPEEKIKEIKKIAKKPKAKK